MRSINTYLGCRICGQNVREFELLNIELGAMNSINQWLGEKSINVTNQHNEYTVKPLI